MDQYRYPNESLILWGTIGLVLVVIAVSATATLCLSAIFIIAMVALAFALNRSHHRELMLSAERVTPQSAPGLAQLARECANRLRPGAVELYAARVNQLNAYTFGLETPKVIVVFSPLLNLMDADELRFVIGHEMGHVALGHTWLNTLLGGMAGIPAPYGAVVLLNAAFLLWNRTCEFSADRAGLIACGSPAKAISALVKLGAGPGRHTPDELARIQAVIEAQDDNAVNVLLAETFASHPMLARRISQIRAYAQTRQYAQLAGTRL